MSDLLIGLLPDVPRERGILVAAVEAGVPGTLRQHAAEGRDVRATIGMSAATMAAGSPVAFRDCYWAATELALALGLITADQADAIGAGPGAAASPPTTPGGVPGTGEDTSVSRSPVPTGPGDEHGAPDGRDRPAGQQPGFPSQPGSPSQPASPSPSGYAPQPGWPAGVGPYGQQPSGLPLPGHAPGEQASDAEPDDAISRAVRAAVRPGLLAFNPPPEMVQGRAERVEVGVARSPELSEALTTGLRGRGVPQLVAVGTSPWMGVELRGSGFEIDSLSPLEQLVAPMARWEFDVTAVRAGHQTLTLCVSLRIESPLTPGGRIAVPVLEHQIRIRVDVAYGARRFVTNNWQWLIATALGLGGALAAWIALVH